MSKIEVNEIDAQSGTTITVGSACKSVAVPGNVVKTNAVQASDGGNIVSQSGTTITLGASGDTVSLASGASQTGFGRTGTVDWETTVKTSTFTAASGEGYFVDTNGGAVTANLPAGTAGAIVAFKDYRNTFDTNSLTIAANGSDKIGGDATNATLDSEGQAVTLVFIDSTRGWLVTNDGLQSAADTNPYIIATGGTETESGNCKIHTFTGPGTFSISKIAATASDNIFSYVVVAGGGGGGAGQGTGGGGGGGYREVVSPSSPYSGSPLDGYPSSPNRITATVSSIPITVGGGGAAKPGDGSNGKGCSGTNSVFSTITSAGGGGGGSGGGGSAPAGANGGSGGGGGGRCGGAAGSGNTPPTTPAQGQNGGTATPSGASPSVDSGGGGGGAGGTGSVGNASSTGGAGGAGVTSSINASATARAGGGGGGSESGSGGAGGSGGGGAGAGGPSASATNGTDNTGGGGGGKGADSPSAGNGGSGVIIIRYRFQ